MNDRTCLPCSEFGVPVTAVTYDGGELLTIYPRATTRELDRKRYALRWTQRELARIHRAQRQREALECGWLDLGGESG